MRLHPVWTLAALVAVVVSCRGPKAPSAAAGAFRPLGIGARVPTYGAVTLRGDTARIGPGEPVTVLNVWATWCTSCREEMRTLESLYDSFATRGVRVVAVSVDRGDDARVRRYAEREGLRFIVAHDPDELVQERFQVVGVPTTLVLDSSGTLRWQHVGNITDVAGEARAAVARLIDGAK